MAQTDYFLQFASEAAALTALQSVTGSSIWPQDYAFPGLQFWRASQDSTGVDSSSNPITTHNYLAGFFVMLSLQSARPALLNSSAVQIVLDRDKANARQAGAVLKSNVSGVVLQDLRFQPVPAGADYPYGNMT